MFGITNFLTFWIAGTLLNITPGSDTMYVLGRSISQGKMAGIYAALGIFVGCLVHVFFAAFGLSVIIQQTQIAFDIIKYAGAAYLCYLGFQMLTQKAKNDFKISDEMEQVDLEKIFVSGLITNVLNPKVALFFIAFLPQFVDKNYENPALSFLILGLTFDITGTLWLMLLAAFSSKMTTKIKENYHIKTWIDRVAGAMFIFLGIKLALEKR
jgi:RhtB (resistance to homoserine/threonine) family protein